MGAAGHAAADVRVVTVIAAHVHVKARCPVVAAPVAMASAVVTVSVAAATVIAAHVPVAMASAVAMVVGSAVRWVPVARVARRIVVPQAAPDAIMASGAHLIAAGNTC